MKQALLIALLVACKSKSSEPAASKPAATKSGQPTPEPTLPASGKVETDDAFKASTQAVAQRHNWIVSAWGTGQLDDTPGADRWSLLLPDPRTGTGDKGAYYIQAGGRFYLLEFTADGKTAPWMGAAQPNPAWRTEAGAFIEHQQGLAGSFTRHQLAIRGGDVVILRTTEKANNQPEKQTVHANLSGACTKPCPKADTVFSVKTSTSADL